ncbi:Enoyl-CoA hydratase / Delta(3)-cis-delta(2)-trans-enoyl-CoA isomerase / 3-hydroxyacyl-CoA dehydrogenase / 3-hydroxybutyryl-CoA epimerase [hydrothermal vent metagenome]|uniref:Enoyl-CoA hydratase / Delta(3)-cis-delta(2)-trans-enoyl-CoA isomerase / 3-hydroxyacyl-CoA dehydrogenase / 3-hydroxybutyryl-CoA epimerase n=1 Tax=hydrothermal vent metagenome TaxID=652676 RepID=A0A1W1C1W1_9ZZZZ
MEEGLKVERETFAPLALSEISKNLIELFFTSEILKKETFSRAKPRAVKETTVIGTARNMKSIIRAFSAMMADFENVKRRSRLTDREIALKMDRVTYTTEMDGLSRSDFVIEAVSEDPKIKQAVYTQLEEHLTEDAIVATNTSSLSITDLVADTVHPERFVGMHFFNPVAKMPLVEVIAGAKTNAKTIATVVDLTKKLGKTPIKVKECAGFLVNRTLLPYLNEAAKMFEEGESVEHIDQVLKAFGMPMGPFTLADEVGLDIGKKVSDILFESYGERMQPSPLLAQMTEKNWLGKKTGKGFYLHQGKQQTFNTGVQSLQCGKAVLDKQTILDRAILIMVNEASRCLEEKVVANARYLDMAMVMGTGFPAFRGGLLRYADSLGIAEVVKRLSEFETHYSERFRVSGLLLKMLEKKQTFYGNM